MKKKFIYIGIISVIVIGIIIILLQHPKNICKSDWVCTNYNKEVLDYFKDIALNFEYGNNNYIVKWNNNQSFQPRIKVNGNPNLEDLVYLNKTINQLRNYTKLDIQFDNKNPNINFYFVPTSDVLKYIPEYVGGNWGYFYDNWNDNTIYSINVFISTSENISQNARNHLIREEFTQSLGLPSDSNKYSNSTFYSEWTETQEYFYMDIILIKMLYDDRVKIYMNSTDIDNIFGEEGSICVDINQCVDN